MNRSLLVLLLIGGWACCYSVSSAQTPLTQVQQPADSVSTRVLRTLFTQSPELSLLKNPQVNKAIQRARDLKVLLYLRSDYRYFTRQNTGDFRLFPVRIDITGSIIPKKLYYRLRTRAFPIITPDDAKGFNKVNFALDYAYIDWKITPTTSIMVGKALRLYGGYEWFLNPIVIYQYNRHLLSVDNFFPVGAYISQQLSPHHRVTFGLYQPRNKSAVNLVRALSTPTDTLVLGADKQPATILWAAGILWQGVFFDGLISTEWSAYAEHFLRNEANYTTTLGQRYISANKKLSIWFDYTGTYKTTDASSLVYSQLRKAGYLTSARSTGAAIPGTKYVIPRGIFYNVLSSRLDWRISKHFVVVGRSFFEWANQLNRTPADKNPGANFLKHFVTVLAVEYYPFPEEHLAIYGASQTTKQWYNKQLSEAGLTSPDLVHQLSVGFLYPLPMW